MANFLLKLPYWKTVCGTVDDVEDDDEEVEVGVLQW